MSSKQLALVLTTVLCLVAAPAMAADEASTTITEQERCCFNNPRFTGTCQVTPGEDETCGSILAYLNNPNSVGRPYCGGTKVRGGWSQVQCEGEASVAMACSSEPKAIVLPAD